MMLANFSADLSTADTCLLAASGNLTTDLLGNFFKGKSLKLVMRNRQLLTLAIGIAAIMIAWQLTEVLSLMLYSYAFMVTGLLVSVVAGLFFCLTSASAATLSMIV